jgi:hypothetical protein
MRKSLFDLIYEFIISIDNDCPTKEIKDEIMETIKTFYIRKVPPEHIIYKYIKLGENSLCEREILKEIGNTILLNIEDENIFQQDYIHSKQVSNYYKYIFLPSIGMMN